MANELQELFGRFYVGSTLDSFSVTDTGGGGAQAVSLTNGWYYLRGYTGEATAQLIEHMQVQVRALGGVWADAAFSYSLSTGLVTLNCPSTTTVTWTWTDSGLQTLLGFTGTQSGAKTYTATQVPQHNWRPSRTMTDYPGNLQNVWQPRSTSAVGRAPGGTTHGVVGPAVLYDAILTWDVLEEAEVLKPSGGTIGGDLESFFVDVVNETQPIRLVIDRTSYAAVTDYVTAVFGREGDETIGSFEQYRGRLLDEYQGLWTVNTPLMKYVA